MDEPGFQPSPARLRAQRSPLHHGIGLSERLVSTKGAYLVYQEAVYNRARFNRVLKMASLET